MTINCNVNQMLRNISRNLRSSRQFAQMTLRELAERSTIGVATISDIENGKVDDIKLCTLLKLATALNTNIHQLIATSDFELAASDAALFKEALKTLTKIETKLNL